MTTPNDRPVYESEIGTYWMEDGILVSISKKTQRTIPNVTDNMALVRKITNNKKPPIMLYLCNTPIPESDTRRFSAEQMPNTYKAMAMISKPGLNQLAMNLLFKIISNPIPMKSFSNTIKAKEWLKQFID